MDEIGEMGKKGGWKMKMLMRKDGKNFWGGKYIKRNERKNMKGFVDIINEVKNIWNRDKDKIKNNEEEVLENMEGSIEEKRKKMKKEIQRLDDMEKRIGRMIDKKSGGIEGVNKFKNEKLMEKIWI